MMQPVRIAVLADIHFGESSPCSERRSNLADILLLRAVHRLNRWIKPDLTVILGDILDDGNGPDASARRATLHKYISKLDSPVVILPGNHDGDRDSFYEVFARPPEAVDVGPVRVLTFDDPEEPGWNARRTEPDLHRLRAERAQHAGSLVTLQHVPVIPAGSDLSPYRYLNDTAVIDAMAGDGLTLAISGHYHEGLDLIKEFSCAFLAAPALCEKPFSFLTVDIAGNDVSFRRHDLAMPAELRLRDLHVHSYFAYCSENMDFQRALLLTDAFNLRGLAFTEHSGQLYFDSDTYWHGLFLDGSVSPQVPNRAGGYFREAAAEVDSSIALVGLEADCDFLGKPVVRAEDRSRSQLLLGAVHSLPELESPQPDLDRAADQFMAMTAGLVASNIHILAHPFRVFRRARLPVPEQLFPAVVALLRQHGVAAEINFHTNEPSADFVAMCISAGVKLAFGSDAHNLYEVGEFQPHLDLLRTCGVSGDINSVLWQPPDVSCM